MGLTVCPTAIVAAPVEVVWANLTEWERYSPWGGGVKRNAEGGGALPSKTPRGKK